jgi:hypothetical protein
LIAISSEGVDSNTGSILDGNFDSDQSSQGRKHFGVASSVFIRIDETGRCVAPLDINPGELGLRAAEKRAEVRRRQGGHPKQFFALM